MCHWTKVGEYRVIDSGPIWDYVEYMYVKYGVTIPRFVSIFLYCRASLVMYIL